MVWTGSWGINGRVNWNVYHIVVTLWCAFNLLVLLCHLRYQIRFCQIFVLIKHEFWEEHCCWLYLFVTFYRMGINWILIVAIVRNTLSIHTISGCTCDVAQQLSLLWIHPCHGVYGVFTHSIISWDMLAVRCNSWYTFPAKEHSLSRPNVVESRWTCLQMRNNNAEYSCMTSDALSLYWWNIRLASYDKSHYNVIGGIP